MHFSLFPSCLQMFQHHVVTPPTIEKTILGKPIEVICRLRLCLRIRLQLRPVHHCPGETTFFFYDVAVNGAFTNFLEAHICFYISASVQFCFRRRSGNIHREGTYSASVFSASSPNWLLSWLLNAATAAL